MSSLTSQPDAVAVDHQPVSTSPVPVCHLSMSLETGGLERLLVDYSRFSDTARFSPRFVALDRLGQPAEDIRSRGFVVDSVNIGEIGKRRTLRTLARLFSDEGIQVLHTHNTYAHFYGAIAARMASVPVVINTQHGLRCGQTWKHRMQFRIANRICDRIVAVSDDAASLCRSVDPHSREKITRIWNGVDLRRFEYHGPHISHDEVTAISVARLSPEKDFPTLLKAVAQARQQIPTLRLKLVGDGVERAKLERLTEELELCSCVEFLGERNDVPELLAKAGFFVSSSLIEGISLTLLEASAVGLPIVATSVGGNPEVVEQGKSGVLVPASDVTGLAEAIVNLCRDRDAWPVMGELGRQRVEQHFNIHQMIRDYESLYSELLEQKQRGHS